MSDAYDRLIEDRLERIEDRQDKDGVRIGKLELWQRTILAFAVGISYGAGALSKEAVEMLQKLSGG